MRIWSAATRALLPPRAARRDCVTLGRARPAWRARPGLRAPAARSIASTAGRDATAPSGEQPFMRKHRADERPLLRRSMRRAETPPRRWAPSDEVLQYVRP